MARREFKFNFSKYTFIIDEERHDFLVYRYDENITERVMNNPLLDLIIAYNSLYEKTEKELTEIKETNKVLMKECDRLIKEKGELLKKIADIQIKWNL